MWCALFLYSLSFYLGSVVCVFLLACYLTALTLYYLATITALYRFYSCLSVLLVSYTITTL